MQRIFIEFAADHTEPSRNGGRACAHIRFPGNIVKVIPDFSAVYNTLCTEHLSEFSGSERLKFLLEIFSGERFTRLDAPARENFIGMMMVLMFVAVVVMAAVLMFVAVVVIAAMLVLFVVMMVMAVLVLFAIMMMAMLMLFAIMMMAMLMLFAVVMMAMLMLFAVVMMAAVLVLFMRFVRKTFKLRGKTVFLLDRGKDIRAFKLRPVRRDDSHICMLAQQRYRLCNFFLVARMRKDDAACIFHLIEEKFAEIFQIHLAFFRIDNGAERIELRILHARALNGADDIGELSDAGRFYDNAVGRVF